MTITPPAPKLAADAGAIRRLRYGGGYSTAQLAKAAGISQLHLNRIENGKVAGSPGMLKKIADALNVTVAEITMTVPANSDQD